MAMKLKIEEFLTKHMVSSSSFTVDEITNMILSEMEKGLKGEASSLPMINSYCKDRFEIIPNENVIVIDAGGTNFRTSLVHFDENLEPVIEDFKKSKMPGIDREVSSKEFFSILADETERLITKADRIGFCFSYEAKILEDHDGVPVLFSKEVKAPEVVGKHLGKELLNEFKNRGYDVSNKKVMILNDTVTTLLAGLCKTKKLNCNGCVGFILGTGTNTAYSENGIIINEESGNFSFAPSDIDKAFIAKTENPNYHLFEKVISGAYLGPLALDILKQAKKENVISDTLPETFTTKDLGDNFDNPSLSEDAMYILDQFIARTAIFTSANLCASIIKSGYGKDKPCLINADGTTFYKTGNLEKYVMKYTEEYLKTKNLSCIFTCIDNSPVIGSAIGALSL